MARGRKARFPQVCDIPGIAGARLRRIGERLHTPGRRGAILVYHRIADVARDTWDLAVSPATFARQMDFFGHGVPPSSSA